MDVRTFYTTPRLEEALKRLEGHKEVLAGLATTMPMTMTKKEFETFLLKTDSVRTEYTTLPPATMTTHYIPTKQFDAWLKGQNKNRVYAEDVKRHLDVGALKAHTGLKTMTGIRNVLVDEDGITKALTENRTLRYNADYRAMWGDKPLYGKVVIVVSDKVYETLPAEKKAEVKDITF